MKYTEKPNYYKNIKWYEKRNAEMMKDKESGMSNADIIAKYKISYARMRVILERGGNANNKRNLEREE